MNQLRDLLYFYFYQALPFVLAALVVFACKSDEEAPGKNTNSEPKLFTSVPASKSGIDFANTLEESLESNYYQYMYTYIGGGVAVGDLNNDGLDDLYFTSNSDQDRLYLNKGDFKFEDITSDAGIKANQGFHTGVTMVDVNQDGKLDIYVSRGGWNDEDNRFANLLYINNGDLTFQRTSRRIGIGRCESSHTSYFF